MNGYHVVNMLWRFGDVRIIIDVFQYALKQALNFDKPDIYVNILCQYVKYPHHSYSQRCNNVVKTKDPRKYETAKEKWKPP